MKKALSKRRDEPHQRAHEPALARRGDGRADPLGVMREQMDRLLTRFWDEVGGRAGELPGWPALDMTEDDRALTLRVDVPGLDPQDLDIEISGRQLTIRGQREEESSGERHGVLRQERRSGSFTRSVTLPTYVDAGKVDARYDKGTLTLRVPKIASAKTQKIPVNPG